MMNSNNQKQYNLARPPASCPLYTYHLPWSVRKEICNLLDADQSWKTLGGRFMGLDGTRLTLIGQSYMRNASPTEELLNRLDSANVRIVELSHYLEQMNQCRALEILKPYLHNGNTGITYDGVSANTDDTGMLSGGTLHTPTPSFADSRQFPAIMGMNNDSIVGNEAFDYPGSNIRQSPAAAQDQIKYNEVNPDPPTRCHKSINQISITAMQSPINQPKLDPGEEIVRKACVNNRKRTSISDQEVVNQLRLIMQITYNELRHASDNFSESNILGNGGFASVYRGHWKGTDVAIKRLKCNLMDQALNELSILNSYKIDNILPIYGISIDGPEACLVYQFMANGSLEDRLSCKNGTQPLSWQQRALIGEGIAKGLYYLHTVRDKPLVHGDVKSANVLLDAQFVPKLGDFGLARQVFKDKNPQAELCTHCTVTSIHGTSVYLPPEYLRYKILSPGVDVYSYGVVLLEMATGKRAYDGKRLLIDLVEDETRSMSKGQIGYSLKDPRLANDSQIDLKIWFELLIKLGISCTHKIKKKRLDMSQVLNRFVQFRTNSLETINYSASNNLLPGSITAQLCNNDKVMQQPPEALQQPNHNSALMSFEEDANNKMVSKQQNKDVSVEAMIPLLTELGLEQNSADL